MNKQSFTFGSAKKPFFSDKDIDAQQKEYTVPLKTSAGETVEFTMSLCMWDWFLILTYHDEDEPHYLPPTRIVDYVITWKKNGTN